MPNGWSHEIGSHLSLGTTFVGSCGVHTSDTSAATTRTADETAPMRPGHDRQTCLTQTTRSRGSTTPVEDVDDEADHQHDDGDQQDRALDLLEVARADVADEHLADARAG